VKLFGTEDQKRRFLPRCAGGAISAFALTEPAVGSDPARLSTIAEPTEDGERFILNGTKLWCTNGTLAELAVVMAKTPATGAISAFVVEMNAPGVKIDHRCRFMGLRALANAQVSFHDVEVPRENLIGAEGAGLKIALVTLNTGRLSLPAATAGMAKRALEIVREWSRARVQWGVPIGKHEAIAHKLTKTAAETYAMESLAHHVADLADRPNADIRLEAAAAKEWNTVTCWSILDDALQIRGGRGYETASSLAARGEAPVDIERALRDARINLIFEGSSEIMHLFMAREAVDKHIQVAGALAQPKASTAARLKAIPKVLAFYAWWYPSRWLGWGRWPRYAEFGRLARHIRFADRAARKLARAIVHGMVVYRAGLERKQAFLFRAVDVAMEIYAMTAAVARARAREESGHEQAETTAELADAFACQARRRVKRLLQELWHNDDRAQTALGRSVLEGHFQWLEEGAMPLGYGVEDLRPGTVDEILAARRAEEEGAEVDPEREFRDVG
jgi:alkylation response protein AidB-like acyl-CoA dehydrogenase